MDMNHGKGMAGRLLASGASPVRKLGKASRRLTAWLLAFVVLCGMVPARSVEASEVRKETASEDVSAAGAPTGAAKRTFAVRSTSGGLDPYAVTLRWKGGDVHCKLDEDGTTAEWTFDDTSMSSGWQKEDMGGMLDMVLDIEIHDGASASDFSVTLPASVYVIPTGEDDTLWHTMECRLNEDMLNRAVMETGLLSVEKTGSVAGRDEAYVIRLADGMNGAQKVSIPLRMCCMDLSVHKGVGLLSKSVTSFMFDALWDGDSFEYSITDGLGRTHGMSFLIHKGLGELSLSHPKYPSDAKSQGWTKYDRPRIYQYVPGLETYYGVSRAMFDEWVAEGYALFEFSWYVGGSAWEPVVFDAEVVPSGKGEIVSLQLDYGGDSTYSSGYPVGECLNLRRPSPSSLSFDVCDVDWLADAGQDAYTHRQLYYMAHVASTDQRFGIKYQGCGFGVRCLVKYPVSDIMGASATLVDEEADVGSTVVECTLNGSLRRYRDNGSGDGLSCTDTIRDVEPYVNVASSGSTYMLDYSGAGDSVYGRGLGLLSLSEGAETFYARADWWRGGMLLDPAEGVDSDLGVGCIGAAVYDPVDLEWVLLGPGDYYLVPLVGELSRGEPIYNASGVIIGNNDAKGSPDDPLLVQVRTYDEPGSWVTALESTYGSVKKDVGKAFKAFENSGDILGFRLFDPGVNSAVVFEMTFRVYFRGDGPVLSKIVAKCKDADMDSLSYTFVGATTAKDVGTGQILSSISESGVSSEAFRPIVAAMSGGWLAGDGYSESTWPLLDIGDGALGRSMVYTCNMVSGFLYDAEGKPIGAWDGPVAHSKVSEVEWFVASVASADMYGSAGLRDTKWSDDSLFSADTAVYRVLVPEGCDVVGVEPGCSEARAGLRVRIEAGDGWHGYGFGRGWSNGLEHWYDEGLVDVMSLDWDVDYDYRGTGRTVLTVKASAPYDKDDYLFAGYPRVAFGGFSVHVRPSDTDVFLSSEQLRLDVASYVVTRNGNPYVFGGSWNGYAKKDDGSCAPTSMKSIFSDLDDNGNTTERIATYHYNQCRIDYDTYVSGMQMASRGSKNALWGRNVEVEPGDSYRYRLTYSQMSEKSEDVILFDSIEDVEGNAWHGTLEYIDLSDADRQGLTYTLYGNAERINTETYVGSNFTADGLTEANGWHKLTGRSRYSWPFDVKSIAVDFGDTVFAKDQEGKPSSVKIWLEMSSPAGGYVGDSIPVSNRGFFSDVLVGSGRSRSVMSNVVTVSMDTSVGYGADKTIALSGDVPEGWTAELSGNKLTIDREDMLPGELGYTYTLRYEMDDPGEDKIKSVGSLVLYDEIESGTDSRYAGKLVGIRVSGLTALPWQVPSSDAGGARMNYVDIGLDDVAVFVAGAGIGPDAEQDGTLAEATGRSDWHLLDTGSMDTFLEANDVSAVAVCLGSIATGRSEDAVFRSSYLEVGLDMAHAGRKDTTGGDRLLKNGFLLSYIPNGTDAPVKMEYPDKTELEVLYEDFGGLELPKTGGTGATPYMVTGCSLALLAGLALLRRRRYR